MQENTAHGSSNGGPIGYTGSPSNAKTCGTNGGCHNTGTAPFLAGIISSNIPSSGYIPGQTYIFTVNQNVPGSPISSKVGFSISPQNATGALLGSLIAGTGTKLNGSGVYVTHTGALMNATNRSFSWVAPSVAVDSVIFYGAVNYTNGLGNSSGDTVRTTTYIAKRDLINSIGEVNNSFKNINVYSLDNTIVVQLESENSNKVSIQVMDVSGKNIVNTSSFDLVNGKNEMKLNLAGMHHSIYFVNIISDKFLPITKKVISM
jgi:hypothetical protein